MKSVLAWFYCTPLVCFCPIDEEPLDIEEGNQLRLNEEHKRGRRDRRREVMLSRC